MAGLRERKSAEVKAGIFRAAMRLFSAKGFDETTVDEIAAAAGVSRTSFFNYFGTKEGVLRYVGQVMAERVGLALAGVPADLAALERIRRALVALTEGMTAHREHMRRVFMYSLRDPGYPFELTPARQAVVATLSRLVAEGQASGELRTDLPAEELALMVSAVYQSALLAGVMGPETLPARLERAWAFAKGGLTDGLATAR